MAEHLWHATVGERSSGHPQAQNAASLRERARSEPDSTRAATLRRLARDAEALAYRDTIARADVVCATCGGAGDDLILEFRFPVGVLDEASQATEPAAAVPLVLCASAVLVGDSAQLPPTVICREAAEGGLRVSLLERLEKAAAAAAAVATSSSAGGSKAADGAAGAAAALAASSRSLLLNLQYRMHPALASFPSAAFYGGRLLSSPKPEDRLAAPGFPWPNPAIPVAFVEVPGPSEMRSPDGTSISNPPEAALAAHIAALLAKRLPEGPSEVGVISPYAGQVRLLADVVAAVFGADRSADVEVKTVDGFQGREKEVIVFSSVRSNSRREVRFARHCPTSLRPPAAPSSMRKAHGAAAQRSCGLLVCLSIGPGSASRNSTHVSAHSLRRSRVPAQPPDPNHKPLLLPVTTHRFAPPPLPLLIWPPLFHAPPPPHTPPPAPVCTRLHPQVGFLSDRRRLNVAITRAKRGLVVLGNAATLSADPVWAQWLDWAGRNGARLDARECEALFDAANRGVAGAAAEEAVAALGGRGSGSSSRGVGDVGGGIGAFGDDDSERQERQWEQRRALPPRPSSSPSAAARRVDRRD